MVDVNIRQKKFFSMVFILYTDSWKLRYVTLMSCMLLCGCVSAYENGIINIENRALEYIRYGKVQATHC